MSDMLSIGASGVRAYQAALTTVSDNIANAGTAGYTRRTTTIREVAAPTSAKITSTSGMGSIASGVVRNADDLRAAGVRSASSDLARTEAGATWLDRIQDALTGNQLSDRITDFFNSAKAVAADPSALAPRATMLESATSVANAFAATGDALATTASDLDASAGAAVTQLNSLTAGLAKVNAGLARATPGSAGAATLADQRDQLLEQISMIADVSVSLDGYGRAAVSAGGGGPTLVQGEGAASVTYVLNDEGALSFATHDGSGTHAFGPSGGALAGIADGALRIASARETLGMIAQDFVSGVNAVQAQGQDLTAGAGAPMFEAGDPATKIAVVLGDPRGIAAASPGGGVRDNANLARLDALRSSGAFEARMTDTVSSNAAALSARQTLSDAQTAIRDSAVAQRDNASGVNIDEEAVDLMRFQQAYQASSRVIQIARETLQSILDIR
ncbi:flagellar hook-associated protein FlgK [Sphingomonas sp.]|uniref:flagellar hook-associated protein FlgK n=1 Tax=Sphingomonas sp. TaxID=28214 RepID=UPI001B1178B7|nr:flagellar hook-associated protein FlgK [Sphingomonas sp.]MBO9713902.1 flagellar hook-associated protein FlgK [Sphingomonas sp.]